MTLALLVTLGAGCGWQDRVAPIEQANDLVVAVRVSPISYTAEADASALAFEEALVERLAKALGRPLHFIPLRSDREVAEHLVDGKAHLGIGWLSPPDDPRLMATPAIIHDDIVLIQNEEWMPVEELDQLSGKTIHLPQGSHVAPMLGELRQKRIPSLTLIERPDGSGLGVLQAVAEQQVEYSAAPRLQFLVTQNLLPELQASLVLRANEPVVWLLRNDKNAVQEKIFAFIAAIHADGSLDRMKDAHFSFRHRLTKTDAAEFIARVTTLLPKFEELFRQAQIATGLDWRLLAALAYQESQWDPLATSPTGVRGMMMLTEETADRLRVDNRLDAAQSIRAGARYLALLRDELPESTKEPDRTWLALAAYNLGMGHLNGARAIARGRKANPDNWFEMKKVLPLLTRPEIYERLKSGRARGGEAVILVENIRAFHDILSRLHPPFSPLPELVANEAQETLRSLRADARPANALRP